MLTLVSSSVWSGERPNPRAYTRSPNLALVDRIHGRACGTIEGSRKLVQVRQCSNDPACVFKMVNFRLMTMIIISVHCALKPAQMV